MMRYLTLIISTLFLLKRCTCTLMQDMGIKWRIGDAEFNWDMNNTEFRLGWQISDAIQDSQFSYRMYDNFNCSTDNGGNDITFSSNDALGNSFYLYTSGLKARMNTPYDPDSDGSGSRDTFLHLALQTEKLDSVENIIWDPKTSLIEFCVRYSLSTDSDQPVEVNYQEVLVTLDIDLRNGFSVTASVVPREKTIDGVSIECQVEGYICDDSNNLDVSGAIRSQGDAIRVCVKTKEESRNDGLYLNSINYFYFYRDIPGTTQQLKQDAIEVGGVPAPIGLTFYTCQPGEDPCGFDSILIADFYSIPGVGFVQGRGEAICQIGRDQTDAPTPGPEEEEEDPEAPTAAPTSLSSASPSIYFDPWIRVQLPTAEPGPDTCLEDPVIVHVTDTSYYHVLDGAFNIEPLNAENTAVNITVTQNFAQYFDQSDNGALNWFAMMYPDLPLGSNQCKKVTLDSQDEATRWGEGGDLMTISALCHEAFADPIQLYVQLDLFMADENLPFQHNNIDIPEQCNSDTIQQYQKKNMGFNLFIPCGGCATSRHLKRALVRNGLLDKKSLLREDENPLKLIKSKRFLQNILNRRLQKEETNEFPPSPPFDLEVQIDSSNDSFRPSSSAPTIATSSYSSALFVALLLVEGIGLLSAGYL